jgi:hypothetical protein
MGADYWPPVIDVGAMEPADLREDGEPLRIVHCPSDIRACATGDYVTACRSAKVKGTLVRGFDHDACLGEKRRHHAGFDHLRGAFSINSVENAALGLVNFVNVREKYRAWLDTNLGVTLPFVNVANADELQTAITALSSDVGVTRAWQTSARDWYLSAWNPAYVGGLVARSMREAAP